MKNEVCDFWCWQQQRPHAMAPILRSLRFEGHCVEGHCVRAPIAFTPNFPVFAFRRGKLLSKANWQTRTANTWCVCLNEQLDGGVVTLHVIFWF